MRLILFNEHGLNLKSKSCWTNAIVQGPAKARLWCPWCAVCRRCHCCQRCQFSFAMCFFVLAGRCPEDESVTAQDGGGTRNMKHHGQQRETVCNFNDIILIALVLLLISHQLLIRNPRALQCKRVYPHCRDTYLAAEGGGRCNLTISDMPSDCEVKTSQWRHQRGGVGMARGRHSKRTMSACQSPDGMGTVLYYIQSKSCSYFLHDISTLVSLVDIEC